MSAPAWLAALMLSTAVAAAAEPVAIVENVQGSVAGAELLD